MTLLRIESRDDGTECRIWVSGEIDASTIDQFRSALAASRRRLVVDMSECRFMDLAGLQCLEQAAANGPLVLIPSRQVSRLLELTATTELFQIE